MLELEFESCYEEQRYELVREHFRHHGTREAAQEQNCYSSGTSGESEELESRFPHHFTSPMTSTSPFVSLSFSPYNTGKHLLCLPHRVVVETK